MRNIFLIILISFLPSFVFANTIGVMSDGDDDTGPHATEMMTKDIDQLLKQLPNGWSLDSIQFTGDISYGNNNSIDAVRAWEESDLNKIPLFLVLGNHEAETTADVLFHRKYFEYYPDFNLQKAEIISQASTTNYSYEIGDIHVSVVNQYTTDSDDFSGSGYIHDDVFNWLKKDLQSANTVHKFVTGHEPLYPSDRHVGDSLDNNPKNRDKFLNLLASYGVAAHVVGHTHFPQLVEANWDALGSRSSILGGGIWELDTGSFGTKYNEFGADPYPALGYLHSNSDKWGDYTISLVHGKPTWKNPKKTEKTHKDLDRQILVNTWDGSGTGHTENGLFDMWYFVDYTNDVEENPDWSGINGGRWWEEDFDAKEAGWKTGELAVGYDDNLSAWGWINTAIDPDPTKTGENQVWGIFGRATFQAANPEDYLNLYLDLDWEDAVYVWLNGTLIHSNENTIPVPQSGDGDQYFDKGTMSVERTDVLGKEKDTPIYKRFVVSEYIDLLKDGTNILAYMSNNSHSDPALAYTSSDSALAIRLILDDNLTVLNKSDLRKNSPSEIGFSDDGKNGGSMDMGLLKSIAVAVLVLGIVFVAIRIINYKKSLRV